MNDESDDDVVPGDVPPPDPVLKSPKPKSGYKRPPEKTRFATGRSGNPKGRPKGAVGQAAIAKKVLFEHHDVMEAGTPVRRTSLDLVLLAFRNLAFNGNPRACKEFQKFCAKYDSTLQERKRGGVLVVPGRLAPEDWEAIFSPKDPPMSEFDDK